MIGFPVQRDLLYDPNHTRVRRLMADLATQVNLAALERLK
jgi:hypothetical protein